MRDLLVRYLLGELEGHERRLLEDELGRSPELQRELAYLRGCLSASATPDCPVPPPNEPPTGLVERTIRRIAGMNYCGGAASADYHRAATSSVALAAATDAPAGTPTWSIADLTVAAGVCLAVSMLFLPALQQSRSAARRTDCANNQRQIGTMLIGYADRHGRFFPLVRPGENAGIFSVYLVEKGYADQNELLPLLVCRSSQLAEDLAAGRVELRIPCKAELWGASPEQLAELRRSMAGSYAYRIGFVHNGVYYGIRNQRSCRSPILADAPSLQLANLRSANHGGCGQNVLYQDGHAGYATTCMLSERPDNIYLNDDGRQAAGRGPNDVVLGPSEATPGIVPLKTVP